MKRTAMVLVLAMVAGAVFASGAQEDAAPVAPSYGGVRVPAGETELVGTYDEIDGAPVIRVNGKTYTAGVPGYRWLDIDLEPGDEVAVSGYLFEETESIDGHLRVTTATIDGTEYDLGAPGMWRGPAGGPHHGYGMMQPYGGRGGMRGPGGRGSWERSR